MRQCQAHNGCQGREVMAENPNEESQSNTYLVSLRRTHNITQNILNAIIQSIL